MKKIWICIICLILALPPSKINASDFSGTECEEAVNILVTLGIVSLDKGNFKLEQFLTRAEMAKLLIKMSGIHDDHVTSSQQMYSDVDPSHWAISYINEVRNLKLMGGYSIDRFAPDEYLTYAQAITALMKLLGYEPMAESSGGYPAGYLVAAVNAGYRPGVTIGQDEPVTREIAAIMLYNILEVPLMETRNYGSNPEYAISRERTLLSENLKIKRVSGQVTGNEYTTLLGSVGGINKDEIEVAKLKFQATSAAQKRLLGYFVDVYYKDYNNQEAFEIVAIKKSPGRNEALVVSAEDIVESTTIDRFIYYDGMKTRETALPDNVNVILNGRSVIQFDESDLMPENGTVTLLDSGNMGAIDVIFIDSYTNYVMGRVYKNGLTIYDRYDSNKSLQIDLHDDRTILDVTKDGKAFNLENLMEWQVVSITKSRDSSDGKIIYSAVVSDQSITGIITEIAAGFESIKIDDETYYATKEFQKYLMQNPPNMNERKTFYQDAYGKLAAIKNSASKNYAYLLKIAVESQISGIVKVRLYTAKNEFETLTLSPTCLINGVRHKSSDAIIGGISDNQLVVYEKDGADQISRLDSAKNSSETGKDGFYLTAMIDPAYTVYEQINGYYKYDNATTVFNIPDDMGDEDLFSVGKALHNADNGKNLWLYDVDENYRVPVMVNFISQLALPENDNQSIMLIDKVSTAIDGDNGQATKLWGYYKGKYEGFIISEKAKMMVSDGTTRSWVDFDYEFVRKGNVLRFDLDLKGQISQVYRCLDYENDLFYSNYAVESSGYQEAGRYGSELAYERVWAYAVADEVKKDVVITRQATGEKLYQRVNSANIYAFDRTNDKVYVGSMDDINVGDELYLRRWRNVELDIVVYK